MTSRRARGCEIWLVAALPTDISMTHGSGTMDQTSTWRRRYASPAWNERQRIGSGARNDTRPFRLCFSLTAFSILCAASGARAGSDGDKASGQARPRPVNFAREVRPILAEHCFACHGPDERQRKAGLRFDTREGVFGKSKNGELPIVPGKPDESELVARIESDELDRRMPPQKGGKPLTKDQIAVLKRWVLEGAVWSSHWAFEPPTKPPLPAVKDTRWPVTEIDRFILARLESEGLAPAPEAAKTTLIRRATLDLTGLPPTVKEVDAFLADPSSRAYERVIDRLLDSPHYGEHMARFWLDAARYGDTHGLHLDNYREAWTYRDWVMRAFNDNKPFDRFVVEQLAGDLLPGATLDQVVATGFNRCHVSTNEGGSIEEEVYVRNIVDQVDTNGTVFLGLTTGCAGATTTNTTRFAPRTTINSSRSSTTSTGRRWTATTPDGRPWSGCLHRQQASAFKAIETQIAEIRQTIARQAAVAAATYDLKADSAPKAAVRRADFVWIDDALPAGATPQGDGPWDYVAKPGEPSESAGRALEDHSPGTQAALLRQRRRQAQGRRGRHALC